MSIFITQNRKDKFERVIRDNIFVELNAQEFDQLITFLCDILNDIFILFSIDDDLNFEKQLLLNNAQDLKGIFLLLLPYIDNLQELKTIHSLSEIYTRKKDNCDISKCSPKYVFSNIQYNRCIRDPLHEIQFDIEHLLQNYKLLKITLQTISNRMYINWTHVVPMTLETYNTKQLYLKTKNAFENRTLREWNVDGTLPPNHLYIGTIYDTMQHYMYGQIKKIKWLLFDYDVNKNIIYDLGNDPQNENIKVLPLIKVLFPDEQQYRKIDLSKCMDGVEWDELDMINKNKFSQEWNNFRKNDNNYDMLKAIAMYFSINSKNAEGDENFYRLTIKKNKENDEICEETKANIIKSIMTIPEGSLYEFLRKSLNTFKSTIYYHILYGKLNNFITSRTISGGYDAILTAKNIYNFAKSFCHTINDGKFMRFPERWVSLDKTDKNEIMRRFNGNDSEWFNIRRNLKRVYKISSDKIDEINNSIFKMCVNSLPDIVFSCLIIAGTISEFTLDTTQRLDDYGSGFYYLNGEQYNSIIMHDENDTFNENGKIKYKEKTYLEFLKGLKFDTKVRSSWLKMYAMNWVSQINFFHKYVNNRIIMATGGTGVGKSTQLPKLLLYALKMVDFKDTGKIICSQPRKRPTSENAIRIAGEMGVTIKAGNELNDYDYKNYNVQFQNHEQHFPLRKSDIGVENANIKIVDNMPYPILRIVTDKILLNSITDPLYKTKYSTIDDGKTKDSYSTNNLYDIVIVDESHEHNQNMDMILSLMRRVLYYNNDCKLVIISATMDEDEPIYRRYYRDINDNRMYPLNRIIEENNLDRINIDRRLHISVPGQTTRFVITEKYLQYDLELNDDDERNRIIVATINQIISTGNYGDILVFKAGKAEIEKCAKLLNTTTPSNVRAIPYFGELPPDVRGFIEKVHLHKSELRIAKDKDISEIKSVSELREGTTTYDHIIIVATNVAEASITIDTLTDVIDDGLQKVNTYYPDRNGSMLKTQKIAESNRLQRKGRVGRTGNGNVYYLYKSDSLKDVRNVYKMCIEDITVMLFSLLRKDKDIKLFDTATDPNRNPQNEFDSEKFDMNIGAIIRRQYFIGTKIYKYIGNDTQYDYKNIKYLGEQYSSGLMYEELLDKNGEFYIIHPNESEINRNILGNIISTAEYERVDKHFERLSEQFLIISDGKTAIKTGYGMEMENVFKKSFLLDGNGLQFTIACVFAKIYGCFEEVLKIITMLQIQQQNVEYCNTKGESDLLTLLNVMNNEIAGKIPKYIEQSEILNEKRYIESKMIMNYYNNLNMFTDKQNGTNILDTFEKYLDIAKLQSHKYNINRMITLSFLHAFGSNIIKKISGTKYYVSLKYPLKDNVKTIKSIKTCVSDNYLNNYLLYINIQIRDTDDIANSEVSMIHYIEPQLLRHISYQFQIRKYIELIKNLHENINYKIADEFAKVRYEIMNDLKEWSILNAYDLDIFANVSDGSSKFITEMYNDVKKYIQNGGTKKYKLIHAQKY